MLALKSLKPKLIAPRSLVSLILNPISITPPQNQIPSGPNIRYLENENKEVNKEFGYSLQENSKINNVFHEENIPIDILNVKIQSFSEEDLTVSIKSYY